MLKISRVQLEEIGANFTEQKKELVIKKIKAELSSTKIKIENIIPLVETIFETEHYKQAPIEIIVRLFLLIVKCNDFLKKNDFYKTIFIRVLGEESNDLKSKVEFLEIQMLKRIEN